MSPRRPTSVTLYALAVLTFAAFYLVRFYNALAQWEYLEDLLSFSPAYLAVTGLVWGLAGLLLAWSLWFGWQEAQNLFWFVFLGYGIYFWLDRLFMPGDPERNANNLFWIGSFVVVAVLSFWMLRRQPSKAFFVRNFLGRSVISGAKNE